MDNKALDYLLSFYPNPQPPHPQGAEATSCPLPNHLTSKLLTPTTIPPQAPMTILLAPTYWGIYISPRHTSRLF